jgi:tyrosine-specific transport protein
VDTKVAGGVLIVVGTSIGGAMLALPIATAGSGFIASSIMLFACWLIMTLSAFFILEVNLWLPQRNNMISMAKATLGRAGEVTAWLSYILLMYALLAAYISGGSAVFGDLLGLVGIKIPQSLSTILFVAIFSFIVYLGIKHVDYSNRALMTVKMGALFILIFFTFPYLDPAKLVGGDPKLLMGSITVMMTSFGFATIVPSLRSYFEDDVKKLRLTILIGSLIPLICYILWDFAILGSLPREGENGLMAIMQKGGSTTDLTNSLSFYLQNNSITGFAHLFTAICVMTSFLCVSLGLSDFLADGLKVEKKGKGNLIVYAATFLPSLIIVLFYPSIFVKALSYAGIFCVMLVVLLPALMVWSGRYCKKFDTSRYQVMGGKLPVILIMLVGLAIVALGVKESF